MPFKSRELFYYFQQAGASLGVAPKNPKEDCIALAALDQYALRSTLLIAGLHYAWNMGNLQDYNSAFLFHKVESIRTINRWLEDYDAKTATICACFGNIALAEVHLDGLVTFLGVQEQKSSSLHNTADVEAELADRYFILTFNFIHTLKQRLQDFILLLEAQGSDPISDASAVEVQNLMHSWHSLENGGIKERLKAMRMLPHFFSPISASLKPSRIDAMAFLDVLGAITKAVDQTRLNPTVENADRIWNDGNPTRLLLTFVNAHIQSFARTDDGLSPANKLKAAQQLIPASFCSVTTASGLYLHSALKITNNGQLIERRLFCRVLQILRRYNEHTAADIRELKSGIRQDFGFWQDFVGAFSLATHQQSSSRINEASSTGNDGGDGSDLQVFQAWFESRIRIWSVAAGYRDWAAAKTALTRITWPRVSSADEERFMEEVWNKAIRGSERM